MCKRYDRRNWSIHSLTLIVYFFCDFCVIHIEKCNQRQQISGLQRCECTKFRVWTCSTATCCRMRILALYTIGTCLTCASQISRNKLFNKCYQTNVTNVNDKYDKFNLELLSLHHRWPHIYVVYIALQF